MVTRQKLYQPWYQWELNSADRAQVDRAMVLTQVSDFADRSIEDRSGGGRCGNY